MATKRIISAEDWRAGHPMGLGHIPSDLYYARICTSFLSKIDKVFKEAEISGENNEDFALLLGHYVEDVVSNTHMFDSFRKLNMKMYGKKLPFYDLGEDYLDDEVNLEDIKFMVWDHVQQLRGDVAIINPDNEMIDWIARQLFPMVCDAFEEVPEATELHDYIFDPSNYTNFVDSKKILSWILFTHPMTQPIGVWEDIITETYNFRDDDHELEPSTLLYATISQYLFLTPCNWLAVYSHEWLAQMLDTEGMTKEAKGMASLRHTGLKYFETVSQTDDTLTLKLSDYETTAGINPDEEYRVDKRSLAEDAKNDRRYILTDLANLNGSSWEINGLSLYLNDVPEKPTKVKDGEAAYNYYLKVLDNKRIGYFKNMAEMQKKLVGNVPITYDGETKSNLDHAEGLVVFLNSNGSLSVSPTLASTTPDPENPYFKGIDKATLLGSIFNSQVASTEMAKYFHEQGWYDDVALTSSISAQRGHDLLHDNFDFLLRYFRGREYHG